VIELNWYALQGTSLSSLVDMSSVGYKVRLPMERATERVMVRRTR
jgi:hypothetical protein